MIRKYLASIHTLYVLNRSLIRDLVSLVEHEREWNFFQEKPLYTTDHFPCDLDTTSIALTVTGRPKEVISSVMDEMLNYIDKDGIIQVSRLSNSNSSVSDTHRP